MRIFLLIFIFTFQANAFNKACFSPNDGINCSCEKSAIDILNNAQKKVDIAIYAINNTNITNAILDAVKRGVYIRMVYDRSQSKASEFFIGQIKEAGVESYYNYKHKIEHNKFIVADDEIVMNGSFNFTETAEHHNSENCIVHEDIELAMDFSTRFDYLFDLYRIRHLASLAKKTKLQNKHQEEHRDEEEDL